MVTGGGSGIGRGLAEAFYRLGNKVIIAGRRRELLDSVTAANPGMVAIELDIADPESITSVSRQLVAGHPTLNVLVNNAGVMPFDDASGPIDDKAALQVLTTNLLGPIRLTSALIAHLEAQPRAAIVNNTSVLAYVPLASAALYCASKAALHSFTLSQRVMLRGTNVTVQEIAPPWVDTGLVGKPGDPRAMPLDAFVAETMTVLSTDVPEALVEIARPMRANPGANEHAMIEAFNASQRADTIAA